MSYRHPVLRHTYVTLGRDAGVPLEDLQDGLGHADPRTTRRYDTDGVRLDRSPVTPSPPTSTHDPRPQRRPSPDRILAPHTRTAEAHPTLTR